MYDRLDYIGNAVSITLDIYPCKRGITIMRNSSYYFDDKDILNKDSIKYYKSFYREGLRLHEINTNEVSTDQVETITQENSEELPKEESQIIKEVVESVIEENSEDIVNEAEVMSDQEEVTTSDDESTSEELEATTEEMIEFLDLTYDENSIRSVAREAGISRIRSDWDKSTIIDKIINNNPKFVINLIKH